VLDVGTRNLDGEQNLAVTELFDLRLHRAAIRANRVRAGGYSSSSSPSAAGGKPSVSRRPPS
jgi:hypothetical protein